MSEPRLGRSAVLAAAFGIAVAGWAGLVTPDPVPMLLGVAALCVVGLTRRATPTIAWLGAITAAFSFAAVPIASSRAADPAVLTFGPWLAVAGPAGVGAILTLLVATWFATRPERPPGTLGATVAWVSFSWFAIAVVVTWVAVAEGQRADPAFTWIDVASAPIAWFVPLVVLATAIGILADLRWAAARAADRVPATGAARGATRAWALALATMDELVPGRGAVADASVAAERRQIAGDLHATVVPSLRRAIEEAEGRADPAAVLRHLRAADLELERLMTDRWPVVLETFGLVAALEDLAERLEAGGAPPITIDVARSEGRPPKEAERAAWRFAQITLDNAVRHAEATSIELTVAIDPDRIRVDITDDGRGFDPSAGLPSRSRGLADLRAVASSVGAASRVVSTPDRGTVATFAWSGG